MGNNSLYCSQGRYIQGRRFVLTLKCMVQVVKRRVKQGEEGKFSISSSPEGGWGRGEVPGTQWGSLHVWSRSASPWDQGHQPHQPGGVTGGQERWHLWTSPGDECPHGHQPPRQKSMSHRWEGKRSGDGGAVGRSGSHHAQGMPVQRVPVKMPIATVGSKVRGGRREDGWGSCYMAVVTTFSSSSRVFS